jgi:ABC-type proline/glycine betaine transport system ATPase subunit
MLQSMLAARLGGRRTCLMVTHDFEPALPLAGRVVILAGGRVALDREARGLDRPALDGLYRRTTDGDAAAPVPA